MYSSTPSSSMHAADSVQSQLGRYAASIRDEDLPPPVVHAATALTIDTLGVLVAGFGYEPCRIARALAARAACDGAATIICTASRTSAELAAFVNATAARYAEGNDVYARYLPGHMHGHPSDVILPLLAMAEREHASGRAFLAAVVLAYEVYLWLCDTSKSGGFDPATFGCLAVAMGAGRLLGLDEEQMRHAIAMAVVPNNILKQVRSDELTPWKAVAAGQAGRAGIFAAELAQAGMPGPNRPFEGRSGWCAHVAGGRFDAGSLSMSSFRILAARMKPRPARALAIAAIQAAERVGIAAEAIADVAQVLVEVHRQAADGTHAEHWHPDSRETADHSIPFGVATALLNGKVTVRSFDEARLGDQRLLDLMQKTKIVANDAFTQAFTAQPQHYCARVSVTMNDATRLAGENGYDADDLATPKSDAWVDAKFHEMAAESLGQTRSSALLEKLWRIADEKDVATIPPAFILS